MTTIRARQAIVVNAAQASLRELADKHYSVIVFASGLPFEMRQAYMLEAEMLFAIGRFLYGREWTNIAHEYDWPKPVGPAKTNQPWDKP